MLIQLHEQDKSKYDQEELKFCYELNHIKYLLNLPLKYSRIFELSQVYLHLLKKEYHQRKDNMDFDFHHLKDNKYFLKCGQVYGLL